MLGGERGDVSFWQSRQPSRANFVVHGMHQEVFGTGLRSDMRSQSPREVDGCDPNAPRRCCRPTTRVLVVVTSARRGMGAPKTVALRHDRAGCAQSSLHDARCSTIAAQASVVRSPTLSWALRRGHGAKTNFAKPGQRRLTAAQTLGSGSGCLTAGKPICTRSAQGDSCISASWSRRPERSVPQSPMLSARPLN